jgi:hypothetical protein
MDEEDIVVVQDELLQTDGALVEDEVVLDTVVLVEALPETACREDLPEASVSWSKDVGCMIRFGGGGTCL